MSEKQRIRAAPWEVTAEMFLSETEVAGLLGHICERERVARPESKVRATVDRLIVELLLFSGLRNSELCRLRIVDVQLDRDEPLIHIHETSGEERRVFIPHSLAEFIATFVRTVRPECLPADRSSKDVPDSLILNERGRPYDRTALYRRVVRILTEAGLEDRASVQLLRHTYGFLAYKRTRGNLLFVQQQLGHAHPMVTAVYAQFVQFSYSELADQVSGAESQSPAVKKDRPSKVVRNKGAKR